MIRLRTEPRARARQGGSAYIIALLALIVLTVLGLALALLTQSELQIGGNERVVNRVFYAADSGIGAATELALVKADYSGITFDILDPVRGTSLSIRNNVRTSPFYPILDSPCNLCEINNQGTYSEKAYRRVNHAVTSTGERRGATVGNDVIAQKLLSAMVEVQPWKSAPEAYAPINDPTQLEQIKF